VKKRRQSTTRRRRLFSRAMIWASYIFISLSLSLFLVFSPFLSRWLIWFKLRGGEWLQPYNCSLPLFFSSYKWIYMNINIRTYICLCTLPIVSITNDYVNRQSWVVIGKNTPMKDSFIFNKVYYISLMSKRLKTRKETSRSRKSKRERERKEKNDVFIKITII